MKTAWLLLALLCLGSSPLRAITPPFEQPRSLGFIEQRGGLAVDRPYRKGNYWVLPVVCNVSGIKTITVAPEVIHAGLAWSKSVALIEDGHIYLTVLTAQQGTLAPSAQCGPARLERFSQQHYEVYYRDPDGTTHWLMTIDHDC